MLKFRIQMGSRDAGRWFSHLLMLHLAVNLDGDSKTGLKLLSESAQLGYRDKQGTTAWLNRGRSYQNGIDRPPPKTIHHHSTPQHLKRCSV